MGTLSKIVRALRESAGWTQVQLAGKARVSQQLIAKIEKGKVSESRKLPRIASAFGLTVEQLLSHGVEHTAAAAIPLRKPATEGDWPFHFAKERWDRLTPSQRKQIEQEVERMVRLCEAGRSEPAHKSRPRRAVQRRSAG